MKILFKCIFALNMMATQGFIISNFVNQQLSGYSSDIFSRIGQPFFREPCMYTVPRRARIVCCAKEENGLRQKQTQQPDGDLFGKAAWLAAEFAGNVIGAVQRSSEDAAPVVRRIESRISGEDAVARLKDEYERNYFISGKMDLDLYEEDCLFADPFASFRGRERFKRNLANLKYFISDSDVRLLDLSVGDETPLTVSSRVMVKLRLALPWAPVLAWVWRVRHVFSESTGRVIEHREAWDIDPMRGVMQVFRPGPRAALALDSDEAASGSEQP